MSANNIKISEAPEYQTPIPVEIIRGAVRPEDAYVVQDYPYGYRLRCAIRYWLEETKRGTRLWSQTSNPKASGEVWNKPKASTYSPPLALAILYTDERAHVHWTAVSPYHWPEHIASFTLRFYHLLNEGERGQLATVERVSRRISANTWREWDALKALKTTENNTPTESEAA